MKCRRGNNVFDVTPEALQQMVYAGSVQKTDVCVSTDGGTTWVTAHEALTETLKANTLDQHEKFPSRSEAEKEQGNRKILSGAVAVGAAVAGLIYWIATGKKPPDPPVA